MNKNNTWRYVALVFIITLFWKLIRFSSTWYHCDDPDGLYLVQDFKVDLEQMKQEEIIYCLQQNLIHRCTASITIFYQDQNVVDYVKSLDMEHKDKLKFVQRSEGDFRVSDIMMYATEVLPWRATVLFLNMDSALSEPINKICQYDWETNFHFCFHAINAPSGVS